MTTTYLKTTIFVKFLGIVSLARPLTRADSYTTQEGTRKHLNPVAYGAFVSLRLNMDPRKFSKLRRGKAGFTLAEMIATLAVFAIVAAIAVPNYLAFQPVQRLSGGTRVVVNKLRWARAQAVERNSAFQVDLINGTTLRIFNDLNGNGSPDTGEYQDINIQLDYPDVTITLSGAAPTFTARGTASGSTTITISNSSGSKQVEVLPSGYVRII